MPTNSAAVRPVILKKKKKCCVSFASSKIKLETQICASENNFFCFSHPLQSHSLWELFLSFTVSLSTGNTIPEANNADLKLVLQRSFTLQHFTELAYPCSSSYCRTLFFMICCGNISRLQKYETCESFKVLLERLQEWLFAYKSEPCWVLIR